MAQRTITATAIAKMAGVGRAAVSNWRRRYATFPAPVSGTSANPLFDADVVEQWLRDNRKIAEASPVDNLWRWIESCQPATRLPEAVCLAGAAMLYRSTRTRRSPERLPTPADLLKHLVTHNRDLADAIRAILPSEWTAQQHNLVRVALDIAVTHRVDAFAEITSRMAAIRSAAALAYAREPVAQIMLDLVGKPSSILDPNCGLGSIIQTALRRATNDRIALQCLGQDTSPTAIALTLVWWSLRSVHAAAEGLSLPAIQIKQSRFLLEDTFPDAVVDAVVSYPPFAIHDWGHEKLGYDPRWAFGIPPRTESELAWVQHAIAHLSPNGRAVLLMPPAAAARTAGRRIRAELVRRGALRAVIALPRGLIASTSVGLHLWVLTRPVPADEPASPLLFGEINYGPDETSGGRLTASDADVIRRRVAAAWQAFESQPDTFARNEDFYTAPAIDVLDDDVDLTPRRYLTAEAAVNPTDVLDDYDDLTRLLAAISAGLPKLRIAQRSQLGDASTIELGDLVRSEALTIQRPAPRLRDDIAADTVPAITAQDVLAGAPPSGRIALPHASEARNTVVREDDVLIPLLGQPVVARVATTEQVGAQLGPGVCAIRIQPGVLDPRFVAGALMRTDSARTTGRALPVTTGLRVEVKRFRVPVLPIDVQRSFGEVFAQLTMLDAQLRRVAVQGSDLVQELLAAIAAGTVEPNH